MTSAPFLGLTVTAESKIQLINWESQALSLSGLLGSGMSMQVIHVFSFFWIFTISIQPLHGQEGGLDWQTLNQRAIEFYKIGEYENALLAAKNANEIATKVFGPSHTSVATTLNNLALISMGLERYEDAESYFEDALSIDSARSAENRVLVSDLEERVDFDGKEKYFIAGELFSGTAYELHKSGKLKSERSIRFGVPHGRTVGYNENFGDDFYEYSYVYNYELGNKVGSQWEYFQQSDTIPLFNDAFDPADKGFQYLLLDFVPSFFGNRDGQTPIDFSQREGCTVIKNGEWLPPTELECPTGTLDVYYEGVPVDANRHSPLLTKCYGRTKCTWRKFKLGNDWRFD